MKKQNQFIPPEEILKKIEHYCAYQDRCHAEVISKLYELGVATDKQNEIIAHLITQSFLNEERFAKSFARGKHRINKWGKNRIISELKYRNINDYLIKKALQEINTAEYYKTLQQLAQQKWQKTKASNLFNKRQKTMAYLYQKGYETDLIRGVIETLE